MDQSLLPLWRSRYGRALAVTRFVRLVPFVRLVGLNGSLVTGRMRPDSDIDFYIVTTPGRLYLTRLMVTAAVHLTGWRRYGRKVRGRICLNRFATTEALDITPHNEYHARVFSQLVPLMAVEQTYQQYVAANEWMKEAGYPLKTYPTQPLARSAFAFGRTVGEWCLRGVIGDILEWWVSNWQRKRIERDPRTVLPESLVRVTANELCFHFSNKEVGE